MCLFSPWFDVFLSPGYLVKGFLPASSSSFVNRAGLMGLQFEEETASLVFNLVACFIQRNAKADKIGQPRRRVKSSLGSWVSVPIVN